MWIRGIADSDGLGIKLGIRIWQKLKLYFSINEVKYTEPTINGVAIFKNILVDVTELLRNGCKKVMEIERLEEELRVTERVIKRTVQLQNKYEF